MKKIGMVLLAAGSSKRYQGIKLLDIIDGKQMYLHILELAGQLKISPKIIVTQYDEIEKKALEYDFTAVRNEEPERGISRSIQLGLQKALEEDSDLEGILFSVCDQPYLTLATLEHLIAAFDISDKSMASVSYHGVHGNPCIIGSKYFMELQSLEGDVGGKKIISKFPKDVESVPVEDEKELADIDQKESL